MKVSELISQLHQQDQSAEVIVERDKNANTFEPLATLQQVRYQKESNILLNQRASGAPGAPQPTKLEPLAPDATQEERKRYEEAKKDEQERQRREQQGEAAVLLRAHRD